VTTTEVQEETDESTSEDSRLGVGDCVFSPVVKEEIENRKEDSAATITDDLGNAAENDREGEALELGAIVGQWMPTAIIDTLIGLTRDHPADLLISTVSLEKLGTDVW
jgi:hypothetical protein